MQDAHDSTKTEDVAKMGHKLAMRRTVGFLVACTPTGTIADLGRVHWSRKLGSEVQLSRSFEDDVPGASCLHP